MTENESDTVEQWERFDLDALRKGLGYSVPERFLARYHEIADAAGPLGLTPWDVIGFDMSADRRRYFNTAPELFPFGWTGCGGCHYGHVVHAPELPSEDLPAAHFCPPDGGPVGLTGRGSDETFANLIAYSLENAIPNLQNVELDAKLRRLVARLELDVSGYGTERLDDGTGNYFPVPPPIAPGYSHVPFDDGIGVFAPTVAFARKDLDEPRPIAVGASSMHPGAVAATKVLLPSHPASALLRAKEIWFHHDRAVAAPLLRAAYEALGRPTIASNVEDE